MSYFHVKQSLMYYKSLFIAAIVETTLINTIGSANLPQMWHPAAFCRGN